MTLGECLASLGVGVVVGAVLTLAFMGKIRPVEPPEPIQRDTIKVIDTITQIRPEIRYIRVTDTMTVPVPVAVHDTVLVQLPREQAVYSDDSTYRAVVSGYRPALDTITVWPTTTVITVTQTQTVTRGRLVAPALTAGYGVAFPSEAKPVAAPYIGVGISVDLIEATRRVLQSP